MPRAWGAYLRLVLTIGNGLGGLVERELTVLLERQGFKPSSFKTLTCAKERGR